MKAPRKWLDNNNTRTLLYLIGMRDPYDLHKDDPLIPYFQYKVGPYQSDYYLYFSQEPGKFGYQNEIFNKMYEYRGHDLVKYIEFHYEAYEDKEEFVRFLRFEVMRQRRELRKYRYFFWVRFPRQKAILETTLQWVEWEEKRLQARVVHSASELPQEALAVEIEGVVDKIGEEVSALLRTYSGKIEVYNEHHITKLIQMLILLKDLRAPGKKVVNLFKAFSDTDLAAILRQFVLYGDYKTNTSQTKIAGVKKDMDLNDPAIQKLSKALQDFFYH